MQNNYFKQLESSVDGSRLNRAELLSQLQFNHDGLIPAIAQQHDSKEVLMMAWMNRESIEETLATGQVCYWSRSRQTYWRKGESSGNQQKLVQLRADCDGDTLLLLVEQKGPACHTDRRSCFYHRIENDESVIDSSV